MRLASILEEMLAAFKHIAPKHVTSSNPRTNFIFNFFYSKSKFYFLLKYIRSGVRSAQFKYDFFFLLHILIKINSHFLEAKIAFSFNFYKYAFNFKL
jgi:hypothetical protein